MPITQNALMPISGGFAFIPSASNEVPGTAITASTSEIVKLNFLNNPVSLSTYSGSNFTGLEYFFAAGPYYNHLFYFVSTSNTEPVIESHFALEGPLSASTLTTQNTHFYKVALASSSTHVDMIRAFTASVASAGTSGSYIFLSSSEANRSVDVRFLAGTPSHSSHYPTSSFISTFSASTDSYVSSSIVQRGSGEVNTAFFSGTPNVLSSSTEMFIDKNDGTSFIITGSSNAKFYLSGSGKIGIGTEEPLADIDLRADQLQIQNQSNRRGIKLNDEGNIESFDRTSGGATTGSELILRYSRGVTVSRAMLLAVTGDDFDTEEGATNAFNDFPPDVQQSILSKGEALGFISPGQAGDTLGAIRWVAESGSLGDYDERVSGEAAVIKAVIDDNDATGTAADLVFMTAGKSGAAVQRLLLESNGANQITGSLSINGTVRQTGNHIVGGYVSMSGHLKGKNSGDGSSDISGFDDLSIFGNATLGNNGNEIHTFYGNLTGSTLSSGGNIKAKNINLSGDLTATNINATSLTVTNITSSNLTSSIIITSGSNIFGDTSADTHTFNGSITASNDIKVSGKVIADLANGLYLGTTQAVYVDSGIFYVGAAGANSHIDGADIELDATGDIDFDAAGNEVKFSKAGTTRVTINTLTGNITASGDISASGEIYSATKQYWSTTGRLVVSDNTTNYFGPNNQGVNYYYWNRDLGTSSTTITSKTQTLNSGFKLPYKAILTGYHLNIQGRSTTDDIKFTLVYSNGMFDGDVTSTSQTLAEAESEQTITISAQNNFYELDRRGQFAIAVNPMTMLYPRFRKAAATGGTNYDFQLAVEYIIAK